MKRNLALLLTSVLLVFALTACGGDKKDNVDNVVPPADNNVTNTPNDVLPGDNNTDNVVPNENRDTMDGMDEGVHNDGLTGSTDNNVSNSVTKQSGRVGVPYSQMLRNGRVHDTDGILTDHENDYILGTSY